MARVFLASARHATFRRNVREGTSPYSKPATASAARGTYFAIRECAPIPTCSRSATRSVLGPRRNHRRRIVDPSIHPRDGSGVWHRSQDPMQTPRDIRLLVLGGGALDRASRTRRLPGAPLSLLQLPDHVLRLLQLCRRLYAGFCWRLAVSKVTSFNLENGPTM